MKATVYGGISPSQKFNIAGVNAINGAAMIEKMPTLTLAPMLCSVINPSKSPEQ